MHYHHKLSLQHETKREESPVHWLATESTNNVLIVSIRIWNNLPLASFSDETKILKRDRCRQYSSPSSASSCLALHWVTTATITTLVIALIAQLVAHCQCNCNFWAHRWQADRKSQWPSKNKIEWWECTTECLAGAEMQCTLSKKRHMNDKC